MNSKLILASFFIFLSFLPSKSQKNNDNLPEILLGNVTEEWVQHHSPGLCLNSDNPRAITSDNEGNVFVTGESAKLPYGNNIVTIKYNTSGEIIWVAKYEESWRNYVSAIIVDKSGNVYITGCSYNSVTSYDFLTIKYNSEGVEQWAKIYNETMYTEEFGRAIDVDDSGNVYVAGSGEVPTDTSQYSAITFDYLTIKYDANGELIWKTRSQFSKKQSAQVMDIKVNIYGDIFVAGNFATIVYDNLGNEKNIVYDSGRSIVLDNSGNACIAGIFWDWDSGYDLIAEKITKEGNLVWRHQSNLNSNV